MADSNPDKVLQVNGDDDIQVSVPLLQKLVAEMMGTYLLIFVGCAAIIMNLDNDKVVTLPRVCIVHGLTIMVLIYSLGDISDAHLNPVITITHASTKRFPTGALPHYIVAQVVGSYLASGTLRLIFQSVATDIKVIGELAGLAVGSTILLNGMFAGPISINESCEKLGASYFAP